MWTSRIFKSQDSRHGDVCPEQANRVLMGWRLNMFWHFYRIPIPLLLVPQFKPHHLKNVQTKNVSLTAMKRVGLCAEVSMEGDVEAFKVMIHTGRNASCHSEMIWVVHCCKRGQWWWSSRSEFYEAVDSIKTFVTDTITKFVMWYPTTSSDILLLSLVWSQSTPSCLVITALAIIPVQTQIRKLEY